MLLGRQVLVNIVIEQNLNIVAMEEIARHKQFFNFDKMFSKSSAVNALKCVCNRKTFKKVIKQKRLRGAYQQERK